MPRPFAFVGGALCCIWLAGCGAATYKARLDETAEYFSYKQKLQQDLGPEWSVWGVSLQTPKQFQMIPPPPPPSEEEGEEPTADITEDPRQPHYLGIDLPGILGAWEATVQAEQGGEDANHKAYLYVLGNHSRFLQAPDDEGLSDDPATYLTEIENLITGQVGVVLPEGDTGTGKEKNQRYREEVPRGMPNKKFTPRKDFTAVTLSPEIDTSELDLPIEMQLYEWSGRKTQVAILMVYPKSVSPRERLQDRLLLALETFDSTDTPPSSSSQSSDRGSGGGGSRPSGF